VFLFARAVCVFTRCEENDFYVVVVVVVVVVMKLREKLVKGNCCVFFKFFGETLKLIGTMYTKDKNTTNKQNHNIYKRYDVDKRIAPNLSSLLFFSRCSRGEEVPRVFADECFASTPPIFTF